MASTCVLNTHNLIAIIKYLCVAVIFWYPGQQHFDWRSQHPPGKETGLIWPSGSFISLSSASSRRLATLCWHHVIAQITARDFRPCAEVKWVITKVARGEMREDNVTGFNTYRGVRRSKQKLTRLLNSGRKMRSNCLSLNCHSWYVYFIESACSSRHHSPLLSFYYYHSFFKGTKYFANHYV